MGGLSDPALRAALRVAVRAALSFDERHLRAVTPLHGRAFTLLPADA